LGEPNVTTIYGEITKVTSKGCLTDNGVETAVDVLICATGFDTTFKPRFQLIGRGGKNLVDEWVDEPRSYLGLAAHSFPNYFM
jgi:cation diffusion facilitator CzcD-associated flavoprotein CzcO